MQKWSHTSKNSNLSLSFPCLFIINRIVFQKCDNGEESYSEYIGGITPDMDVATKDALATRARLAAAKYVK